MRSNKYIYTFLFICLALFSKAEAASSLNSANDAYAKGNYEQAIEEYEAIISDGKESAALYFNLGNAYFKNNNLGYAILNYERAKKLDPEDDDISTNLKLAYQKTEDKIEAAPKMFLSEWKTGIVDLMDERSWSITVILLISLALALIAVYILSSNKVLKQIGFFFGSTLIILSVFSFFLAKHKYNTTINSNDAIITSSVVTVTGSPSEKGTKLFLLHEGVKVDITSEEEDWTEIRIPNGNVGWVKTAMLQKI